MPADVVVPVPDSGVPAAMGYSKQSGIPFELGIIRNHYVGRTFIEPTDHIRHLGVKLKHSANRPVLEGKRVILVDDSIVRGTTSKKIVEMVRAAGRARRCTCASPRRPPRIPASTASTRRSAASCWPRSHDVEEMAELIGVDSLAFISIDGLYRALGKAGRDPAQPDYCDACFTGDYPISLPDQQDNADRQLSLLAARPLMPRPARRRRRPGHRRQPRHRRRGRDRTGPPRRAVRASPPAPRAGWRRPTTRSAPSAARRRCCRSTCAKAARST